MGADIAKKVSIAEKIYIFAISRIGGYPCKGYFYMKKTFIFITAASILFSLGACKPKKSAYRQVYEQAKQREIAQYQNTGRVSEQTDNTGAVLVSKPAQSDFNIRQERLNTLDGEDASRLKTYSVVIGSFQNHTNANALKERMESAGYKPVLASNEQGMLRVIAASFDSRSEAEAARDKLKELFAPNFSDAWLLELQK